MRTAYPPAPAHLARPASPKDARDEASNPRYPRERRRRTRRLQRTSEDAPGEMPVRPLAAMRTTHVFASAGQRSAPSLEGADHAARHHLGGRRCDRCRRCTARHRVGPSARSPPAPSHLKCAHEESNPARPIKSREPRQLGVRRKNQRRRARAQAGTTSGGPPWPRPSAGSGHRSGAPDRPGRDPGRRPHRALCGSRTHDPGLTMAVLCRLS